jgi:thiosulfate/3-mercaptopyruvate sulfurtransferase
MYNSVISTQALADHLSDLNWILFDCQYSLANPGQGQSDYIVAHIPGAVYVHLDLDLSGPVIPGKTGRHPLPDPRQAAATFSRIGVAEGMQVVVYDAAGGASAAVRAWWMLHWLGHEAAAVLDGGWQKWQGEGRPTVSGIETRKPASFNPVLHPELVVDAREVERLIKQPAPCLFDSRAVERYRGENETIDPVAGHIPGARSAPYSENLNPDGTLRSPEALRERFQTLIGDIPAAESVFYCGSGVTAIHNILAMAYAGLGMARLYAGSWSEWITNPQRPVAR